MEARRITELSFEELAEVQRLEVELDGFIEKRAKQAKGETEREELWKASVDKYHEKRRRKAAEEWFAYHDSLVRSHEATLGSLVSHHRKERARYARILGLAEFAGSVEGAA